MSDELDFENLHLDDYGPTDRDRPFDDILTVLGPMTHVTPVTREEAERYRGLLPDGLLDFWVRHGRGALLKGYAWICDPAMFEPVLQAVFDGDPEYKAEDFTCYVYDHEGRIHAWSPVYHGCKIDIIGFESEITIAGSGPNLDVHGNPMSDDLAVGHIIRSYGYSLAHDRETDFDQFTEASRRLGLLEPGEIFGFFPSRQMGGEGYASDMRKTPVVEHLLFHVQLGRATLMKYVYDPKDTANPLGRREAVRLLGPQE